MSHDDPDETDPNALHHGQPQQPWPQQNYQQQPNVGGMPMTGQFAQAPRQHPQHPQSGAVPHMSAPVVTQGAPPSPSTAVPVLSAPVVAVEEEAQASRVVYGLSGTAVGGSIGVLLGMLNTQLEGISTTEGLDFILNCALWSAFFLGLLCFLKPERFAYALHKFTEKNDDDE